MTKKNINGASTPHPPTKKSNTSSPLKEAFSESRLPSVSLAKDALDAEDLYNAKTSTFEPLPDP
ncbi:MAG: hypothetical protein AAGJ35_13965, partial [Myxococcota bacterium]